MELNKEIDKKKSVKPQPTYSRPAASSGVAVGVSEEETLGMGPAAVVAEVQAL